MSLASRVNDLAIAIRDKLNTMTPRLLPAGGAAGQVLAKSSGADYASSWATPVPTMGVDIMINQNAYWN